MTGVRCFSILLFSLSLWSSAVGQSRDRLDLFAYDPQCEDYIVGYSIGLLVEGRLVGRPSNLCELEVDLSGCVTTLCKVHRQLAAWHDCTARIAKEGPRSTCDWQAEGTRTVAPPLAGGSVDESGEVQASACFETAALLLRSHLQILLSPTISPDDQDAALDLNLEALEQLRRGDGKTFGIACGHHMAVDSRFPSLPAVKSLRLMIMAQATPEANRPTLFALARLAYEEGLGSRRLPRDLWFGCFVELEYQYFVARKGTDRLFLEPLKLCPTFSANKALRRDALRDLQKTAK